MNKWDQRFLDLAQHVSTWSKDPSTKVGAVIVDDRRRIVSVGYNGFPRSTDDSAYLYEDRDRKYRRIVHAETNALLFADRNKLEGSTIYTWPFMPCSNCTGNLIQCGIVRAVAPPTSIEHETRWAENFNESWDMLFSAGVKVDILGNAAF